MNSDRNLHQAFLKYDEHRKGYLNKLELKCAFIFLTGFKPGKQDLELFKNGNQDFHVDYDIFS